MGTIDPTVAKNQVKAQFVLTHSSFMWKSSPERINRVRHQLRYAFREVRLETRLIAEQTREVVEAAIELLVMRCKESLLIEIPTVKNVYRWQNFSRMKWTGHGRWSWKSTFHSHWTESQNWKFFNKIPSLHLSCLPAMCNAQKNIWGSFSPAETSSIPNQSVKIFHHCHCRHFRSLKSWRMTPTLGDNALSTTAFTKRQLHIGFRIRTRVFFSEGDFWKQTFPTEIWSKGNPR